MPAAGKKALYGALGLVFVGLAVIGIWLPGLPTTPFVLIALWAFSNSSNRLHRWLLTLPLLKHAVREAHRFQREGSLHPRVKLIAQGSAWLSCVVVTLLTRSLLLGAILVMAAIACSIFMNRVPSTEYSVEEADA